MVDYKKLRIGDYVGLTHRRYKPEGKGYHITGYKKGYLLIYQSGCGSPVDTGVIKLHPSVDKQITIKETTENVRTDSTSSYYHEYTDADISTWEPIITSNEIGSFVKSIQDGQYFVAGSWGMRSHSVGGRLFESKEGFKIHTMDDKDPFEGEQECRSGYNSSKMDLLYLVNNVSIKKYTGKSGSTLGFHKFFRCKGDVLFHIENKNYLSDLSRLKDDYKREMEETWEDEETDDFYLVKFDTTDEFIRKVDLEHHLHIIKRREELKEEL